jgi:tRNA-(ms[2]io[6]A)-hydroxylase
MFCLRVPTDPAWAKEAVRDLDAILVDHAHCEMKAATNALSLVVRHPNDFGLVRALTDLPREELDHFRRVVAFIERRGLELGPPPVDTYASDLRRAANVLKGHPDIPAVVDRLLVSALIEARSAERFKLLLAALPESTSPELRFFYEELFACEARHYRTYVDLASLALTGSSTRGKDAGRDRELDVLLQARLSTLADAEGKIVQNLAERDERATVHG